ncbi:response regulator [Streptomyces sp. NPDC096153]|uniref:response regulator transcription factor n=1 Tax=Streptomyces sp. NPDC096153 TaxID=3155548 RepID=UPI003325F768
MAIHVLIADDSEIVRRGLSDIVEAGDDLHVVAQAWDGRSAVDAARQFSPDVALVDIRMPGWTGRRRPGRSGRCRGRRGC